MIVRRSSLAVVLGCCLLLAGCAAGGSPPAADPGEPPGQPSNPPSAKQEDGEAGAVRYLALGDSLTQGVGVPDVETGAFPALLAKRWRGQGCQVELRNVGVSGYTAGQIVTEQLPALAEFNPTIVTFQAGANDIANGVTLDEYRTNVRQVLESVKASGARSIVLAENEWFRSPEGVNYGSDAGEKRVAYDAALIEEATAQGAEFVDLRPLYRQQADNNEWVEDGLHPTPAAYDAWADVLARVVPAPCR